MNPLTSYWHQSMQPKFNAWWSAKTAQEKADLESVLVIAASALSTIIPLFIISLF